MYVSHNLGHFSFDILFTLCNDIHTYIQIVYWSLFNWQTYTDMYVQHHTMFNFALWIIMHLVFTWKLSYIREWALYLVVWSLIWSAARRWIPIWIDKMDNSEHISSRLFYIVYKVFVYVISYIYKFT